MCMEKFNKFFIYLACAWALIFAVPSFYWATGGNIGLNTLGSEINALQSEPWFLMFVLLTAVMKVGLGIVVLMLLKKYSAPFLNKIVVVTVWAAGVICLIYGSLNLFARFIMAIGLLPTPEAMHSSAAMWHLVLWDPWWVLGGILLILAVHTAKK